MCTVSWLHQPGGYHLFCNRDEKRTRALGFGPRVEERGGVRFVAPVDGDRGGTWIAVNEFGVALCLLNGQPAPRPVAQSRGMVIRELIWGESAAECVLGLKQLDLGRFAPFTLAILEPDRPTAVADWDGKHLIVTPFGDCRMPLTSSSYDPEGVRDVRLAEFSERVTSAGRVDPALFYSFHASHREQPDAYSPCMHRADAETVSFSWVVVSRDQIRFFYSPAAPCVWTPGEQQVLPRAA